MTLVFGHFLVLRQEVGMSRFQTVHVFDGQFARTTVLQASDSQRTVVVAQVRNGARMEPSRHDAPLTLKTAEFVFEDPDIAREVGILLKNAAVLAHFIEAGGTVEHWFGNGSERTFALNKRHG
jgi:hypothetical protein